MVANPGKLALLHVLVFVVVFFTGPVRLIANLFGPLFGENYKKWLEMYIPSYSGYIKFLKKEWNRG
jgi:hypothetical protein